MENKIQEERLGNFPKSFLLLSDEAENISDEDIKNKKKGKKYGKCKR